MGKRRAQGSRPLRNKKNNEVGVKTPEYFRGLKADAKGHMFVNFFYLLSEIVGDNHKLFREMREFYNRNKNKIVVERVGEKQEATLTVSIIEEGVFNELLGIINENKIEKFVMVNEERKTVIFTISKT